MRLEYLPFDPDEHIDVLYQLLLSRRYNISHSKNPTEKEHSEFCLSHPYRYWYLIYNSTEPIGAFYITNENCIAINLVEDKKDYINQTLDFIFSNFNPLSEIPSVIPPNFYCNIHPLNRKYIEAVSERDAELIQWSYVFKNNG